MCRCTTSTGSPRASTAVGACGVDYVKVGIERVPQARAVLDALARSGHAIVPVFIADKGLDASDVAHACTLGFPGVMADTADKLAGSLFDVLSMDELRRFVATVRGAGAMVGLAGALRAEHQPLLSRARTRLRRLSHGSVRGRPQLGARPAAPAGIDPADAGPGARRSGVDTWGMR